MRYGLVVLATMLMGASLASAQCFPQASCRIGSPPTTQVIASGGTITADACGTVKNISAAGAVTTSTTNTFDAPNGGNAGCTMVVCNQSANTITLDSNTNFPGVGGANVSLTQLDCIRVLQTGTQWFAGSAAVSNN